MLIADAVIVQLEQAVREAGEEIAIVAHEQEGAVVALERILQHVLALDVQVVRGFVKDQEIQRFQEHAAQREPRAFATAEHLHFLVHILAAEHERAEHRTHACAVLFAGGILGGLQHGELRIHALGHILRVVAHDHVVAERDLAVVRFLADDHADEG